VASRRITSVEQRYAKTENANEAPSKFTGLAASATNGAVLSEGTHADREVEMGPAVPALGPIRRNAAVIAGAGAVAAMSVGSTNSRYNNLLPRSAAWDAHEMARELATLAEEMARVLPGHHESTRRARHLLEKAQTIFAASPERSAEVDYYLAQVRSIVQRSRQTLQWSNLYRKRLMLYYSAWLLLSVIMVAGGFLFGSAWGNALAALFGWDPNGFLALNAIPALVAMFSGSLGGSLGGIWNLQRYHSQGLGFIDRKFSLRGLVLPLMGLLTGFILYAIAAGISWALAPGTPPSPLLWFIPALLAFAFGLLQETIYGTRD
jgi:hypothetical protein